MKLVMAQQYTALATGARGALASLALCSLLASFGTSSATIALPTLMHVFDATFSHVQWVVLAYLFAVTVLVVSVGRLGDIAGRRRLLLAGIALFATASLLCGCATALWMLVAARAVQGLGAAIMMALGMAFIGEVVAQVKSGRAMGLLGAMSALGTALGPSLGGLLIDTIGWPAVFLVNVPLAIVTLVLAYRHLPKDARSAPDAKPRFDYVGTLLLAFSLAAFSLALTTGEGTSAQLRVALLLAAIFGAMLFVKAESVTTSPMISPDLLRDPVLAAGFAMSLLVATVMMATLVVGPLHLTRAYKLDAAAVGLAMAVGPIAAALAGIPAGRLVDRFGAQQIGLAGLFGLAASALAMSLLPASYGIAACEIAACEIATCEMAACEIAACGVAACGVAAYLACIVAMTIHFSLFQAANNTAVMRCVAPQQRGVVSGLLNLSRNLGFIAGASLMATLYDSGGRANAAAALRATFAVAAVLVALAFAIGLVVHIRKRAR